MILKHFIDMVYPSTKTMFKELRNYIKFGKKRVC